MGATATDVGEQGCIPTPKYPVPVKPVLEKKAPAAPVKKDDTEVANAAKPAPSKAPKPAAAAAPKPAGLAQKKAEPAAAEEAKPAAAEEAKPAAAAEAPAADAAKPAAAEEAKPAAAAEEAKPAAAAEKPAADAEKPAADGKKTVAVDEDKAAGVDKKEKVETFPDGQKIDEAGKAAIQENISAPKHQTDEQKAAKEKESSDAAAAAVASPPKVVPLNSDGGKGAWDNRAGTDNARDQASKQVASQNADEAAKVKAITEDHSKATAEAAEKINVNNRKREGAQNNNWHEYWVTKVKPQPTPEHDQHDWAPALSQKK